MKIRNKRIKSLILILLFTLMIIPTNIKITKAEALDTDVVTFKDVNLEAVVREKLGKASGGITVGDMKSMTGKLNATNRNISDLSGLEHAVNLTILWLDYNQITDVTPLKDMTGLTILLLNDNLVKNISPLINLTNLTNLWLHNNQISDISSLSKMTSLSDVVLYNNQISDIQALRNLGAIEELYIYENNLTNLNGLENMTSLKVLSAFNNKLTDISALSGLSCIEELYVRDNNLTNLNGIENMTSLQKLDLNANQITDIAPLINLTSLKELYLHNNKIKNIDAIREMTWITGLNVNDNLIEEIPTWFNELPNLTFINMSRNKLTGTIPSTIGELTNLEELSLNDNYLTGEIPVELNNLTQLTVDEKWNTFKNNYLTGTVPEGLKSKVGAAAFYGNLLEGENNQKQLTLLPGAELNLSLNSSATSNTLKSITKLFDGEDSHSKSLYELELVPTDESFFDESGRAIKSGSTTAYIKIKDVAESNPYTKTLTTVQVNISDKIGSNSDITIEFSIDNALEVILGANNINFGNVSAEGGEVEATTLTVTSSLPYDISTKAYNDFIGSSDPSNIIPIEKVSLDIDDLGYIELSKGKTLNLGDNPSAIDKIHNLNFKISDTLGYKKDNYRAELQFIIDTK